MKVELFSYMVYNISLLVTLGFLFTRIPVVRRGFYREQRESIKSQIQLGILFGGFSVFSTFSGISVSGAIQNTRVIGVLAAGLMGGPVSGTVAALLAGVHRYFYDMNGFTSFACMISTFVEGAIGIGFYEYAKKREQKFDGTQLFFIAFLAECVQMLLLLLLAKPFSAAKELVSLIALPMIFFNSCGMVVFFAVFQEIYERLDLEAAGIVKLALDVGKTCMPYMQKKETSIKDLYQVVHYTRKMRGCDGVVITGTSQVLACSFSRDFTHLGREAQLIQKAKEGQVFSLDEKMCGVCAPIQVHGEHRGYLMIFNRKNHFGEQTDIHFVEGLAQLFSTQKELAQLEEQKKMRQKAEIQALQSQINPHFLFNALNTISFFCREKPEKARELILALSTYFRKTLGKSEEYMIPLREEVEFVASYVQLEEARFEERLTVEMDVEEGLDQKVPRMILQPIVENAIKHGAMMREKGLVWIRTYRSQGSLWIEVEDNGKGFQREIEEEFKKQDKTSKGVALSNVQKRLKSIYGTEGLKIQSSETGSTVTLRIPGSSEV